MHNESLEKLTWVLIYGGLLALCLGLFLRPGDDVLGWAFIVIGVITAVAGAALVWVRSRRGP